AVPLNSRKIEVDLTRRPDEKTSRVTFAPWTHVDAPVTFVAGRNHGSIMSKPQETMIGLVKDALRVGSAEEYTAWKEAADRACPTPERKFQQFVVHLTDERGDGVTDYNIELYTQRGGEDSFLDGFDYDVHAYARDKSYRCFHADIGKLTDGLDSLFLRLTASSGTILVGYSGFSSSPMPPPRGRRDSEMAEFHLDLSGRLQTAEFKFFFPFTTTLIEICIDREPL